MIGRDSNPTMCIGTIGRIWTIGHAARDFDDVAADLNRLGVQTIIDVRSQPHSTWAPDFTKDDLEEFAASAGFGYRWLGRTLGGRPPPEPARLEAGLEELLGLAASSRVVLLCAEGEPAHCHRDTILAPALAARGCDIVHILPDGTTTPYQDRLAL